MRAKTFLTVFSTAVLLIGGMGLAGPALADTGDACGVNLVTGDTACRSSDADLAAWAQTDMNSAAPSAPAAGKAGPAGTSAPATSYLIGKIWQDQNKSGSSYEFFVSGPCNGNHSDVDWELGVLNDIGWNNKISSFQGYSNCYIKLYENINYNTAAAGSTYGPYSSSNYVGNAMNDQSSSIRFY